MEKHVNVFALLKAREAAMLPSCPNHFVEMLGLEIEGWVDPIADRKKPPVYGGVWDCDAGVGQLELITDPCRTVSEAYQIFRNMLQAEGDIVFTPSRPADMRVVGHAWNPKPRYEYLIRGLRRESPNHWGLVNAMTETSALQASVSGSQIDVLSPAGIFLLNFGNHLAPYMAAVVHENSSLGHGHLKIWRKFGDARRFWVHRNWFADMEALRDFHTSVPRLFRSFGNDQFADPETGERQVFGVPSDHGVMWWFFRPKCTADGTFTHLEMRVLPSMPLLPGEIYTEMLVDFVNWATTWFYEENKGQPVPTLESAAPAFAYVAQKMPRFVPDAPLRRREWYQLWNK